MKRRSVRSSSAVAVLGFVVAGLAGCTGEPQATAQAPDQAAAAQPATPYKPVATNRELMESLIAHAAEEYWGSVRIVVDAEGEHEHFPETDEDWEEVWAAGLSLAEAGNLLMMPPRAVDAEWVRISGKLVDVGVEAAAAALARDPDKVLEAGERVYNVCVECHQRYVPDAVP